MPLAKAQENGNDEVATYLQDCCMILHVDLYSCFLL